MNTVNCKSCGRPIIWLRTKSGKAIPCDPDLKILYGDPQGKEQIVTLKGEVKRGVILEGYTLEHARQMFGWDVAAGYISHFATCPNADKYRKRKH